MPTREEIMLKAMTPALTLVSSWLKEITPTTPIAGFMQWNIPKLMEEHKEIKNKELDIGSDLLTKLMIAEANKYPEFVEEKIERFVAAWFEYKKNG